MRQSDRFAILKFIPPKVAVSILIAAILYALLQPTINSSLGWKLPSIASIIELGSPATSKTKTAPTASETRAPSSKRDVGSEKASKADQQSTRSSEPTFERPDKSQTAQNEAHTHNTAATGKQSDEPSTQNDSNEVKSLRFGILHSIGRDRYRSPAGLVYGPGSEQGHRLKHIELHLSDQPNRPGSHGVFEGDMKAFLVAIDDAYDRATAGSKGTSRRNDDDAVVYEASFAKPIGYLGGLEGKRKNNPELKRLRVVVSERNNSVITAFPF